MLGNPVTSAKYDGQLEYYSGSAKRASPHRGPGSTLKSFPETNPETNLRNRSLSTQPQLPSIGNSQPAFCHAHPMLLPKDFLLPRNILRSTSSKSHEIVTQNRLRQTKTQETWDGMRFEMGGLCGRISYGNQKKSKKRTNEIKCGDNQEPRQTGSLASRLG